MARGHEVVAASRGAQGRAWPVGAVPRALDITDPATFGDAFEGVDAVVPVFVHVSSIAVYGLTREGPIPEDTPRIPETDPIAYNAAKSAAEGVIERARGETLHPWPGSPGEREQHEDRRSIDRVSRARQPLPTPTLDSPEAGAPAAGGDGRSGARV